MINRHDFDQALTLAQATRAKLHLLHVLSVEDKGSLSLLTLQDANFEQQWEEFAKPSLEMVRSPGAIALVFRLHQTTNWLRLTPTNPPFWSNGNDTKDTARVCRTRGTGSD
jgi:hypothetical protein